VDDQPMSATEKAQAEAIAQQADVRRALEEAATHKVSADTPVQPKQKVWLGTYALLLLGLGVLYYLLRLRAFGVIPFQGLLQRFTLGAMAIVLVLVATKAVDALLIDRLDDVVSRYNLKRVLRLITGIILFFIGLSLLFANWYTAVLSLGLISLILGFALQTPITSFIGWIYILVKKPYRVGDRIKIRDATGDVLDVSYLDTTLWEFGGEYLSTDHPSGRLIKFPNSEVLTSMIYNYSWPLFPYIWNEIKFHVGYDSDLDFVACTMREVAEEEIGSTMMERVRIFRELLAKTPVITSRYGSTRRLLPRRRQHVAGSDRPLYGRAAACGQGQDKAHRQNAGETQRRTGSRELSEE
jgi:small-conductance mechanosensitive channel